MTRTAALLAAARWAGSVPCCCWGWYEDAADEECAPVTGIVRDDLRRRHGGQPAGASVQRGVGRAGDYAPGREPRLYAPRGFCVAAAACGSRRVSRAEQVAAAAQAG